MLDEAQRPQTLIESAVDPEARPKESPAKRLERFQFQPGNPGGPGRGKGRKDNETLIKEAKVQLLADILQAQPSKRFYKRWLKNYAARHPKEALELVTNTVSKLEGKEKGDTHLHFNLASLVAAAGKKQEAPSDRV